MRRKEHFSIRGERDDVYYEEAISVLRKLDGGIVRFYSRTPTMILPMERYTDARKEYYFTILDGILNDRFTSMYMFMERTTGKMLFDPKKMELVVKNTKDLNDILLQPNFELRGVYFSNFYSCMISDKLAILHYKSFVDETKTVDMRFTRDPEEIEQLKKIFDAHFRFAKAFGKMDSRELNRLKILASMPRSTSRSQIRKVLRFLDEERKKDDSILDGDLRVTLREVGIIETGSTTFYVELDPDMFLPPPQEEGRVVPIVVNGRERKWVGENPEDAFKWYVQERYDIVILERDSIEEDEIFVRGVEMTFGGAQKILLKILALHANRFVSVEKLFPDMYPEYVESNLDYDLKESRVENTRKNLIRNIAQSVKSGKEEFNLGKYISRKRGAKKSAYILKTSGINVIVIRKPL